MSLPDPPKPAPAEPTPEEHLDALLDEALEETFPASDPPAMTAPARAEVAPLRR